MIRWLLPWATQRGAIHGVPGASPLFPLDENGRARSRRRGVEKIATPVEKIAASAVSLGKNAGGMPRNPLTWFAMSCWVATACDMHAVALVESMR